MYGDQKICRRGRALAVAASMAFSGAVMAASPHYSLVGSMPPASSGFGNPKFIVYKDGMFYGEAAGRPFQYGGSLFSMTLQGKVNRIHAFDSHDGSLFVSSTNDYPVQFLQLNDGSLFGVTTNTAFALSPAGAFGTVHTYEQNNTFYGTTSPYSLVTDRNGDMYGMAFVPSGPAIVAVARDGQTSTVYEFGNATGGYYPVTNLLAGPSGEFYTTLVAPTDDPVNDRKEYILKIKDGASTLVHALAPDSSEGEMISALVMDTSGNLVGDTKLGGSDCKVGENYYCGGVVFRITPDGGFSVVRQFDKRNGDGSHDDGYMADALLAASDGNVYGVTDFGGRDGNGAIFRVARNGRYSVVRYLANRKAGVDDASPKSLIQVGPRTIYGVLPDGGINGTGAIFKLVMPIQDDVIGSGSSELILTGPGLLSTGPVAGTATHTTITAGYYPVAAGDFNGDGVADLLWTSAKRDLYIWYGGTSGFTSQFAGTYPAGWSVVGAGDFDGDGMDDLAWIDRKAGQFAYWLMNGAVRKGYKIVRFSAGYFPATVGDYDGDGRADVLWSSAKHDLYAWLSRGQGFVSKFVANFPAAWQVAGRGDLDGDGKADLVWTTGDRTQWGYWLMDGGSVRTIRSFTVPVAVGGSHVAAVADYDGDGLADVLWSDGHALTLWGNQGGCLDVPGCAFSTSVPSMTLSSGQTVLNSGLPVSP
jgi:uncharacterized repeat protein (TIGR03803 family)